MISRVRIEAEATSVEQAKHEIDILIKHLRQAAYLEGIASVKADVSDEHYGGTTRSVAGKLTHLYEGRQVVTFDHNEVVEGGLKQYGFKVLDTNRPKLQWLSVDTQPSGVLTYTATGSTNTTFSASTMDMLTENSRYDDVTDQHIVLERVNPASRQHAWDTEPQNLPGKVRVAYFTKDTDSAHCDVEFGDDDLMEDVAARAADELLPKQEDGTRWTLQYGTDGPVANPQIKAKDYLADNLKMRLIQQSKRLMYGKLPNLIPLDTHNR